MSNFSPTEQFAKSFTYTAVVKLKSEELGIDIFQEKYPGIHTFSCSSRKFSSFDECASSCRSLMEEVVNRYNVDGEEFKVGSEVNPLHSGTPTLSKDWGIGEISRLWIYRKNLEKSGHISAVGQARLFASAEEASQISFN